MGIGCDTTHSLQIIQCDSFAGKQRTDISSNNTHQLTFLHFIAVFAIKINLHIFIQDLKYSAKYIQSGNDSVLFADQLHLTGHGFFHHRIGGHVLTGNVLLQRFFYQMVYIQCHRNLIHFFFPHSKHIFFFYIASLQNTAGFTAFSTPDILCAARFANTRLSNRELLARRFAP